MFWPSPNSSLISNISRVGSFGLTFPFMLFGLLLSMNKRRIGDGNYLLNLFTSPAGLLLTFSVIYAAIHLLTWALIRYRLHIDAVLLPFAAFALSTIFEPVNRKYNLVRAASTM